MKVLVFTQVVLLVVALVPVKVVILFHLQAVVRPATTILPTPEEPMMLAVVVAIEVEGQDNCRRCSSNYVCLHVL